VIEAAGTSQAATTGLNWQSSRSLYGEIGSITDPCDARTERTIDALFKDHP
jgi:hypothetical protein